MPRRSINRMRNIVRIRSAANILSVVVAIVCLNESESAHAQPTVVSFTSATGGDWQNGGLWIGGTPATGTNNIASFVLDIPANTNPIVTLTQDVTIAGLRFDDTGGGNQAQEGSWILSGPNVLTLSSTDGIPTITVTTGLTDVARIDVILAGTTGFTKLGPGRLVLTNAANTMSGTVTIAAGILRSSSASVAGVNLNLAGGTYESSGLLTRTLGFANGDLQFSAGSNLSAFGGTLAVSFNGGTTLTWNATTGFLTNGQTLGFSSPQADATVDFQNSIDLNGGARTVTVANGGALTDAVISGNLINSSGTGAFIKQGAGVLELTGVNTYNGATSILAGVLTANGTALSANSPLSINGGSLATNGTFTRSLGSGAGEVNIVGSSGFVAFGGQLDLDIGNGAALTWGSANFNPTTLRLGEAGMSTHLVDFKNSFNLGGASRLISVPANITGVDARLSGAISGSGGLTFNGAAGVLVELTGDNVYTGATTISNLSVRLSGSAATAFANNVTSGNLTLDPGAGGSYLVTTGTIARTVGTGANQFRITNLAGFAGFSAADSPLYLQLGNLQWGSTDFFGASSTATFVLGTAASSAVTELQSSIDLNTAGTRTLFVQGDGTTATAYSRITGNITGVGTLVKTGPGLLELTGTGNTAGWRIDAGVIRAAGAAITSANITFSSGTLESSGVLNRSIGGGAGQLRTTTTGAIVAVGGDLAIGLSGTAAEAFSLVLGSTTSTNRVDLINTNLNLGGFAATFDIADRSDVVDTIVTGTFTNGSLVKAGAGVMELQTAGSTANVQISAGAVRSSIANLPTGNILLAANTSTPASIESSGTFARNIGTGAGQIQWLNGAGFSSGFAAVGGDLAVSLNGSGSITWADTIGNSNLLLGSANSTHRVDWTNTSIDLGAVTRTINVGNAISVGVESRLTGIQTNGTLVKTGAGTLEVTGIGSTANWQINAGAFRATNAAITSGNIAINTGVLESNGLIAKTLGVGTGSLQFVGTGGGGFAAVGGNLTLSLSGGAALTWATAFVANSLTFGSVNATDRVELANPLGLQNNQTRFVTVIDNSSSENDVAVLSGVLSGNANSRLVKQGPGTLILSAANTYGGLTSINAGTLQIGDGGTTGSVAGSIAIESGATLAFNRSNNLTYAGVISGGGGVRFNGGPGVVTLLTGANTYTGTTTIAGASVRLSSSAATAFTDNVTNGNLTLEAHPNGSYLITTGTIARTSGPGQNQFRVTGSAGFAGFSAFDAPLYLQLGNLQWGSTDFFGVTSTAAFVLGTGASTALTELQASIDLNTTGSRTLIVAGSGTTTTAYARITGDITGAGTLVKSGTGLLELTGTGNTAGWRIESGVVRAAPAAITSGNIALGGSVAALESNGTLARTVGTGVAQIQWIGNSGFAAVGGDLSVSLNGGGSIAWADTIGNFDLLLGSANSTHRVDWTNASVDLGALTRTINVADVTGVVTDARLTGSQSNGTLVKTGGGLLEVTGTGSTADWRIDAGTVRAGAAAITSGNLAINGGVLEANGTLARTIGVGTGSLQLSGGGFAAVGGDLSVSLNGGGNIAWADTIGNFDLLFGSANSTHRVDWTNASLDLGAVTRTINVADASGVTVEARLTGNQTNGTLIKTGAGTLEVTGVGSTAGWQINAGTLRAESAEITTGNIAINGGVLESNGLLARTLGVGTGSLQFIGNGGGFAAVNGTLTISLNGGVQLNWASFNNPGTLTFGSANATDRVFVQNAINLQNAVRSFTVIDNPNSDNDATVFNGALTNAAGRVAKEGSGTLILAGNNGYTGFTTVNAGTLQIGNSGTTGVIIGGIFVGPSGTLAFNRSNAHVHSTAISGGGQVIKLNTNELTLDGINTYTGATIVSAGTLNVAGALGNTAVTVASGATLSGTGTLGGTVSNSGTLSGGLTIAGVATNNVGGAITPGTLGTVGTLTLGSLVLGGGSLNFDLGATGAGNSDYLSILGGAFNVTGATTLTFNALGGFGLGTYDLVGGYTGAISGLNLLSTPSLFNSFSLSLTDNGGILQLLVTESGGPPAGPQTLTWTGANDALWNTTSANWTGSASLYTAGDNVTFNDTASVKTLTIASPVAPGSIVVDVNTSYTFLGAAITGTTSLLKQGSGTLTLAGSHAFTGPTTVQSGVLQLGGDYASSIELSGALLQLSTTGNQTLTGLISGTGFLQKLGSGTTTLLGVNTFSGITSVDAGTLVVNHALNGTVFVNAGGAFSGTGASTSRIIVQGGSGSISGTQSGALEIGNGSVTIQNGGATTGTVAVGGGQLIVASGGQLGNTLGINIGSGGTLNVQTGGQIVGNGQIQVGGILIANGDVQGTVTVNSGGVLHGNGSVGAVVLQNGGTLSVGNSVGSLTIDGDNAGGPSLTLNAGSVIEFEFNDVDAGPGIGWDYVELGAGLLTINAQNQAGSDDRVLVHINSLTLANAHGANDFNAAAATTSSVQEYYWKFIGLNNLSQISTTGPSSLSGRFHVIDDLVGAGVFDLADGNPYDRPISSLGQGTFKVLAGNFGGQGNGLYIYYSAVPEPGSMLLAGLGSLAAGWYGRRRLRKYDSSKVEGPLE